MGRGAMLDLQQRVVVVTGASSGVGRAVARAAAARGARVALIARGLDGLEAAAREVEAEGGESLVLPLDLADAAAVEAAADRIAEAWGGIDVWVNDAMVSVFATVDDTTPEEYQRVLAVNFLGTVHGTRAALRHMRARGAGHIVQMGSALAYRSIPLQSAYCASKAAVRAFTDSLRCELLHEDSAIAVTMVQLPAVNTPQFEVARNKLPGRARPVPPTYQPEEMARAVLYAIARRPRELKVGWSTLAAIFGQALMPGWLDRFLADRAWRAQLAPGPARRSDNLDRPLPGDRGAHGRFEDEARPRSLELRLRTHRGAVVAGALAAALALFGVRRLLR